MTYRLSEILVIPFGLGNLYMMRNDLEFQLVWALWTTLLGAALYMLLVQFSFVSLDRPS